MRRTLSSTVVLAVTVTGVAMSVPASATAPSLAAPTTAAPATTLAAATVGATDAQAGLAVKGVHWRTCADPDLRDAGATCGTLAVPLDYGHPNGKTVKLALSRVKHTVPAAQYQGVMLTNPGGPGGSGLTLSTLGQYVPKDAGAAYDWIGFDPRGVGSSSRAVSCKPSYFGPDRPDYVVRTRHQESVWLKRSAGYAKACKADAGSLLRYVKTIDTVHDMERIRKALGQKKISFYGFSYGTYLAQVYATKYPTHVHRMVLDGTVDPRRVWYKANLDQDKAFERNIGIWFGWVAKHNSTYHLGKTRKAVEKRWYAEQAKLAKKPAGGKVGPDEWNDVFVQAAYYQITWTDLADVFNAWAEHRDVSAVVDAYRETDTPGDDNGFAMYNATQCTDVQWPKKWSTWRADARRVYKKAPFLTWNNTWYNAPCLTWPAKAGKAGKPVKIDGRKAPAILMINETLDAATPYAGSLEVRRRFPRARLIAEPGGTTHAGTLYGNDCVDNRIADYLLTGKLAKRKSGRHADVICKPLPRPVPGSGEVLDVAPDGARTTGHAGPAREELARYTPR